VVLVNKLKESGIQSTFTNFWPLKKVLKEINTIFDDRIQVISQNKLTSDIGMNIFVFNRFLITLGFKRVAENKYLQFLMNILHYSQIFRVNVFARFMGLLNDEKFNYSIDELDKYVQAYDFINNVSVLGVAIQHADAEPKFCVSYLRAMDYVKTYLEKIMSAEDMLEI
jgi:hypothetical protein